MPCFPVAGRAGMPFTFRVMASWRRGTVLELEIDRLAFGGRGVATTDDGLLVLVEDALPGQRVRARIRRVGKAFTEARIERVLRQSPAAVAPRCSHFGVCGGCRLQHLDYPAQLAAKRDQVKEILERIGGFAEPPVEEAIPSPRTYGYRNKMEYSFGDMRWLSREEIECGGEASRRHFALGLHPRRRWDRVIQLEECHLPQPRSVEIVKAVQEAAAGSDRVPFSTKTHEGFWRFLVIREGVRTGQWMVDIVTSDEADAFGEIDRLAAELKARFPQITTVTHTLSRARAAVAVGERMRVLEGPGFIEEEIAGLTFRISPGTFFQTNTEGAERLYKQARYLAGLQGGERVYDVYCGTGAIALLMAEQASEAVGFERAPSAVIDARANAELNGIDNVRFIEGDAAELLKGGAAWGAPDAVILDPPRAGLHPDLRKVLPGLGAERLVYVSCNPTTLARDLKELSANGFGLQVVQPVDMFPHTPHVECIALLESSPLNGGVLR